MGGRVGWRMVVVVVMMCICVSGWVSWLGVRLVLVVLVGGCSVVAWVVG